MAWRQQWTQWAAQMSVQECLSGVTEGLGCSSQTVQALRQTSRPRWSVVTENQLCQFMHSNCPRLCRQSRKFPCKCMCRHRDRDKRNMLRETFAPHFCWFLTHVWNSEANRGLALKMVILNGNIVDHAPSICGTTIKPIVTIPWPLCSGR